MYWTKIFRNVNHMTIDELNSDSSVTHVVGIYESYIPALNWEHLNLVEWLKQKNLSNMFIVTKSIQNGSSQAS